MGSSVLEETWTQKLGATAGLDVPLCVDMDGTLIKADMLLEGLFALLKRNLKWLLHLPRWLVRGKANLKAEVAARAEVASTAYPVHERFIEWLGVQHEAGRKLILCTAAARPVAENIAARFGLFDDVICSDAKHNLSGENKARRLVERFGEGGFDYAGNDWCDLQVWRRARHSIVVSPGWWLSRRLTAVPRLERVFPGSGNKATAWLRALRLHQWAKNLLIFVPLVAAHQYANFAAASAALTAFLAFSVCASATYIINDLFDLEADRLHPRKCRRPFAACDLSILEGCVAAVVLLAIGFAAALLWLPLTFSLVLAFYVGITLWYSSRLKRLAMVDILSLTSLYTLRIIAGAAATHVIPSFWLLAFSMFIFLSLAAAKRYTELHAVAERGGTQAAGRGYTTGDLPLVLACGVASGYTAVLVVALYVQSSAAALYSRPLVLWLLCPIVLYWISRIWLKAHRGQLHDDPLVFAMTDRPSICALLLLLVLAAGAI